eukprot:6815624-Alexandrium_andersonii.AAC.1
MGQPGRLDAGVRRQALPRHAGLQTGQGQMAGPASPARTRARTRRAMPPPGPHSRPAGVNRGLGRP